MKNSLKFTGKFNQLKELGYTFMKLYARDYKVYSKKMLKTFDIWVWVANGGYIEVDDLYSNTNNFVTAIKSIDWASVQQRDSVIMGGQYKRMYIRLNHSNPELGYQISDKSFEFETIMSLPKDVRIGEYDDNYSKLYDEAYTKAIGIYDREKVVFEESGKILIEELNKINLVNIK
jgi:hypothetical protein